MPLDIAQQLTRQALDFAVAITRIEHERFQVTRETHRPVYLRFDMGRRVDRNRHSILRYLQKYSTIVESLGQIG